MFHVKQSPQPPASKGKRNPSPTLSVLSDLCEEEKKKRDQSNSAAPSILEATNMAGVLSAIMCHTKESRRT